MAFIVLILHHEDKRQISIGQILVAHKTHKMRKDIKMLHLQWLLPFRKYYIVKFRCFQRHMIQFFK